MSTEIVRPSAWSGAGSSYVSNGANAYDANTSTYASVYCYNYTTDIFTTIILSGFGSKAHSWSAGALKLDISGVLSAYKDNVYSTGKGQASINIYYSLDSGATWVDWAAFDNVTPTTTISRQTLSVDVGNITPSQVQIKLLIVTSRKVADTAYEYGWSASSATLYTYEAYLEGTYSATPTVTGVTPPSGTSLTALPYGHTGTLVIAGTNFDSVTAVKIGNTTLPSYTVNSSTQISVPVNTLTQGLTGVVSVTTSSGTGSGTQTVTVNSLSLSAFVPSVGSCGQNLSTHFTLSGGATNTATVSVTGGSLSPTAGSTVSSNTTITWTLPSTAGTYYYTVQSIDAQTAGSSWSTTATVTVYALPVISSFSASTTNPNWGQAVILTPVFSNGTGVINGASIASGGTYSISSATTQTTYTLTVTNPAGATVQSSITVVPKTPTLSFPDYTMTVGHPLYVSGTLTNTAESECNWSKVSGPDGVTWNTPGDHTAEVSAVWPGTAVLKCTHLSGVNATTTITILPEPSGTLTASTLKILRGGTITLTPVFSGGTGAIDQGVGAVTSGTAVTLNPTTTKAYTLTVTNPQNWTYTQTVTVQVYDLLAGVGSASNSATAVLSLPKPLAAVSGAVVTSYPGALSTNVQLKISVVLQTGYTVNLTNKIKLEGPGASANASAPAPVLSTGVSLKTSSKATTGSWGNVLSGTIWILGSGYAVATNVGSTNLTASIRLKSTATQAGQLEPVELLTSIAFHSVVDSKTLSSGTLNYSIPLSAVGRARSYSTPPHLDVQPSRVPMHVPGIYTSEDPDGFALKLFQLMDQELAKHVQLMRDLPVILTHAPRVKVVKDLLDHLGNPFKFQVEDSAARQLVGNLMHLYAQRGSLVGVLRAIRFLLKRDTVLLASTSTTWRLGVHHLGSSTKLAGRLGTITYWVGVPDEFNEHQTRNLKAIVQFMAPSYIQFKYLPLSRLRG